MCQWAVRKTAAIFYMYFNGLKNVYWCLSKTDGNSKLYIYIMRIIHIYITCIIYIYIIFIINIYITRIIYTLQNASEVFCWIKVWCFNINFVVRLLEIKKMQCFNVFYFFLICIIYIFINIYIEFILMENRF